MPQKTQQIAEGVLLEYSVEGYTITASDWNNAMGAIKTAINKNAQVLSATRPGYYQTTIQGNQWTLENSTDPNGYCSVIRNTTHKIPLPFTVMTYSMSGDQINGMSQIDFDTGDITLRTRIPDSIILIVQGVGT